MLMSHIVHNVHLSSKSVEFFLKCAVAFRERISSAYILHWSNESQRRQQWKALYFGRAAGV